MRILGFKFFEKEIIIAKTIEVNTSKIEQVEKRNVLLLDSNSYTLVPSSGVLILPPNNTIPSWFNNEINSLKNLNDLDLVELSNRLELAIKTLDDGFSSSITQINKDKITINKKIDTVKSSNENALATVVQAVSTKITQAEARTTANNILTAMFNNDDSQAKSWFVNNIETYSNDIETNASNLEALFSSFTDKDTGLLANAEAIHLLYTKAGVNKDGSLHASSGYLITLNSKVKSLREDLTTEAIALDKLYTKVGVNEDGTMNATVGYLRDLQIVSEKIDTRLVTEEALMVEAHDWSANASKLITDTSGNITGWSFGDGTRVSSNFTIKADNFYIESSSDPSYRPFKIEDDRIEFTGVVKFKGLGISTDSTTINGGKIQTNTINANKIEAGTITSDRLRVGTITADKINITDLFKEENAGKHIPKTGRTVQTLKFTSITGNMGGHDNHKAQLRIDGSASGTTITVRKKQLKHRDAFGRHDAFLYVNGVQTYTITGETSAFNVPNSSDVVLKVGFVFNNSYSHDLILLFTITSEYVSIIPSSNGNADITVHT